MGTHGWPQPGEIRNPEGKNGTAWGNSTTNIKERQWYAALADRVGHRKAPEYADDIINWSKQRPPDHALARWLKEYEDGVWEIDDRIRSRVEHRVDRFHKQEHISFLRQMIKAGKKALTPVEDTGDMPQPVILKYIADGVNQGMMLHSARSQQATESLSLGGLTINVGNRPTPRKLRPRQAEQLIEGDFTIKEVPAIASGSDSG